ncbi:MAG: GH92 family glycosyl hydrolase [Bacteroidaceae bacterium]|nr:GH92 family glycosyl hydrolase [Bacteroidaceae bacterium]
MKRAYILILSLVAVAVLGAETRQLADYVDPRIGSAGHGHVFVGACVPWGMVDAGPVQPYHGWDWCSGYHASGDSIVGFAQTHLSGTGCSDLGDITIMPVYGLVNTNTSHGEILDQIASTYSHDNEIVKAGYYKVRLDKNNITAEITASERVAFYRFTFPRGNRFGNVFLDLENGIGDRAVETRIWPIDPYTMVGYRKSRGWSRHTVYYAIRFDRPVGEFGIEDYNARYAQAVFNVEPGTVICAQVSVSPVSEMGALQNLLAETSALTFDQVREYAWNRWNTELNRVDARFAGDSQARTFYTALYHTMIAPQQWNDVTGDYMGCDGQIHRSPSFRNYTTWSLWDTYRALHPMATIIMRDKLTDWANTMINQWREWGELPVWHLHSYDTYCMVGEPGVPVLADMVLKGVQGIDCEEAFKAMKQSMNGTRGKDQLWKYGYIPYDMGQGESVAKNLEYFLAAWSVAQVAGKLGHKDDSIQYAQLAGNYRMLYDRRVGYIRAKDHNGNFRPVEGFVPNYQTADYTEGNPWHYLWLVPHDIPGLIDLLGGKRTAEARLDSMFVVSSQLNADANPDISGLIGQYCHGNEPSHHTLFVYNYLGKPRKTQARVHEVLTTLYSDKPDGICGNEDVGQMSAWYVMASLGLYQVEPCGGRYQLCTPAVKDAVLNVGDGKTFVIKTKGSGIYVRRWILNGKPVKGTVLNHCDIVNGGTLEVELCN